MDDKVNDFLNEINEIAPPPTKPVQDEVWKQCFDELTGYAYYWNKKTDEVSWTQPESLNDVKTERKPSIAKNIPTEVEPLSVPVDKGSMELPEEIPIYTVGKNSKKLPPKKHYKKDSDSEDEKITLISSYGTDSESEDESPDLKKVKIVTELLPTKSENLNSDDDDDLDILAEIQKKAQELKKLGGEIPVEIKEVVESSEAELLKTGKVISGVSLVAGYSDSEEENDEGKAMLQSKEKKPQISHSTLFPIPKPINIDDFTPHKTEEIHINPTEITENFDNKAFQRKRRIGVALVNTVERKSERDNEDREGFGFDKNVSSTKTSDSIYKGISFVKSDTLNPSNSNIDQKNSASTRNGDNNINSEEVDDLYTTLQEKLTFLNEGRPDVSPVQSMVIQAETLFLAMNYGALEPTYLLKWLKETCSELIKLETEATPTGWMLQWDRSHKRYFYQNLTTGGSQWEYPQPDISTGDDAMDISTTPPHVSAEPSISLSPPLPPTISSPTPPPPPIISCVEPEVTLTDVPLPKELAPWTLIDDSTQPLPPGVDGSEIPVLDNTGASDPLNSALDSFYSDIAAISASPPQRESKEHVPENFTTEIKSDTVKKKKKTKVKLASGLAMQKKGVSKLVEKWKNLQNEYN